MEPLLDAPPNHLALYSMAWAGVNTLGLFAISGTCGMLSFLSPFGLLMGWLGLGLGLLGIRHARIHGFGGSYARYGVVINGFVVLVHSMVCSVGTFLIVLGSFQ